MGIVQEKFAVPDPEPENSNKRETLSTEGNTESAFTQVMDQATAI